MTEAMPFLQKYDITFLRPPTISGRSFVFLLPLTNGPPAPAGSGARQRVTVSGPYAPHRPVRGGLFLLQNC